MKHFLPPRFSSGLLVLGCCALLPLGALQAQSQAPSQVRSTGTTQGSAQPPAATGATSTFRAGFVNIDRILREANAARAAQGRLEQEFAQREKSLLDQGRTLRSGSEQFERDAPTMSESQRTARQRQLLEQDRDFQRRRREFEEDLTIRKQEEMSRVLEQANQAVQRVAEREHYDVILQEAVYINPSLDITDKVIQALNSGQK